MVKFKPKFYEGIRVDNNEKVTGILSVLERYNKYYIMNPFSFTDNGYIPIREVYKDSIVRCALKKVDLSFEKGELWKRN